MVDLAYKIQLLFKLSFVQLFAIAILYPSILYSQNLSPQAEFTMLTCSPGEALYSTFGHSAIRLFDPVNQIDKVYNYGTFDFEEPNFGLKFLRGKLNYALGVSTYANFLREYKYFKRDVWEQHLNLNEEQKSQLYSFLEHNYRPENRSYLYDFFFDNCSSRIRDVFENLLDDYKYLSTPSREVSFRQLLDEYLKEKKWLDFGIDLILGAKADDPADFRAQMFLPDYLHDNLEYLKFGQGDTPSALITSDYPVLKFDQLKKSKGLFYYLNPVVLVILLLILELLLFLSIFDNKRSWVKVWDCTWFALLSASSIILCFMWFGTDHQVCRANWNLLWANPLYIIMLFPGWRQKPRYLLNLLNGLLILNGMCLLFWPLIPQQFHYAIVPVILISLLKLYRMIKKYQLT